MSFEKELEQQILSVISKWNDNEIYAISFLVDVNQLSVYKGIPNFPEFSIGYNTEKDCNNAALLSEERWNFAFWSQNNIEVINPDNSEVADKLIQWYGEQGVTDIGFESEENMYDDECNYIGRGPNGYWELLLLVSDIGRKIQLDGQIRKRFGEIPIIVHDIEYSWYTAKVTENANPQGEAKTFLDYLICLSKKESE